MFSQFFGHSFFGHNSGDYYLSNGSDKSWFWCFFEKKNILAGKWAWLPRWCQRVWGLKTQPKSWPTEWNFWVNRYLSQKSVSQFLKSFIIWRGNCQKRSWNPQCLHLEMNRTWVGLIKFRQIFPGLRTFDRINGSKNSPYFPKNIGIFTCHYIPEYGNFFLHKCFLYYI